jgi:hypothetical protein
MRSALPDGKRPAKEVHRRKRAVAAGATARGIESGRDLCFANWKPTFASLEFMLSIASEPLGAKMRAPRASRVSRFEAPDDSSVAGANRRTNTPRNRAAHRPQAALQLTAEA